jgi:hypothetical protein
MSGQGVSGIGATLLAKWNFTFGDRTSRRRLQVERRL